MPPRDVQDGLARLTPRQREVLELLSKGLTNEEIGGVLGVGAATVKTHVSAVLAALQVSNRTEAAGLVNAADPALAADFVERPAVAVLPFEAVGWDGADGPAVADGLADDLVSLLSKWRWFPVIARASSAAVTREAGPRPVADLGRRLGARYLLHGRVHRDGRRIRVWAHLDDADRGELVWSDRFDGQGEELFELVDEVAAQVVGAAFPALLSAEIWRARRSRASTLDVWTGTHRALGLVERREPDENRRALALLDDVLARDDAFLPALHARGTAVFHHILNQWADDRDAAARVMTLDAERAVALYPEAALGHLLRARCAMHVGAWDAGIAHAEVATAINPSLAEGHSLLGQLLATTGRLEEGLERLRRAHRLSPRASVAGIGIALFAAGRFQEALGLAEQVLADRPRYLFARMIATACSVRLGLREHAERHVGALRRDFPRFRTSDLSRHYEARGYETGDRLFAALHEAGIPR